MPEIVSDFPPAPRKLLIVSASVGGGHVAAAQALEAAAGHSDLTVRHVDVLQFTGPAFQRLYRDIYFDLVQLAPEAVSWFGDLVDRRPSESKTRTQQLFARLSRVVLRRLPRTIDAWRPDMLLHTHFLPSALLASTSHRRLPSAVVVTDYEAHAFWLQPSVDRYYVASDAIRAHLLANQVDADRIRVTGIPVGERFGALPSKLEARCALGLDVDRDVLLLLASGLDAEVLERLVGQLKELRWPLTTLVVCGRSSDLVQVAKHAIGEGGELVDFRVIGFSSEMPQLMAAADVLTSKPGGLTSSEALAAGLPIAIVSPYPLQEEANARHLLEVGAGLSIDPLTVFGFKLKSLLADPERRAVMRENALRAAHPHAARDIIRSLVEDPPTHRG